VTSDEHGRLAARVLHPATLRRLFVRCAYGLSWQVVPTKLAEWAKDPAGPQRVMRAVMPMKKLDIATLEKAYNGK
jgi:predicted 3-demethylubiquinone-9 3-methyltransferase (glyoxalase superfamily)